jgi:hypothetical protein
VNMKFTNVDIVSFSTLSLDMLDHLQIGGPPCYGESCFKAYGRDAGLRYRQVVNMHPKDLSLLPEGISKKWLINPIEETVRFKLSYTGGTRDVALLSKSFELSGDVLKGAQGLHGIKSLILSPIINELSTDFFQAIVSFRPQNIFIDLFNNDDGLFDDKEASFLRFFMQENFFHHSRVWLKLSSSEYEGLKKFFPKKLADHLSLIVTQGEKGAFIMDQSGEKFFPAKHAKIISTIGCGDVFLYQFAVGITLGYGVDSSMQKAVDAASGSAEYFCPKEMIEYVDANKAWFV